MSFLTDFEALRRSIPVPAIRSMGNEACEYIDYGGGNHRCVHSFVGMHLEDSLYCDFSGLSHFLVDSEYCGWCDYCYEAVNAMNCYGCTYIYDCTKCRDCHLSSMCVDCNDCFGCVALTHKQNCIFNTQYTPQDYKEKIREIRTRPFTQTYAQFLDLLKKTPYPQSIQRNNENSPFGDYLSYSKNVYWGFNTYWLENSGYVYSGGLAKNCWDLFVVGGGSGDKFMKATCEWDYECVGGGSLYNCSFLFQCNECTDCTYGWDLRNCSDCFGCVALSNKKYCVLNTQYTKEEYEKRIVEIKKELGWTVIEKPVGENQTQTFLANQNVLFSNTPKSS